MQSETHPPDDAENTGASAEIRRESPARAPLEETRTSLLRRLREGQDQDAWAEFYALYRPMMSRFAAAYGLRGGDIDDVVQDCMGTLSVHLKNFSYDSRIGRFRSYLKTVVSHRCAGAKRAKRDCQAHSGDLLRPQEREPDVDALFDRIWDEEMMRHCLACVARDSDPVAMRAFQLHNLEQRPMEQVVLETGLSPRQVYKSSFEIRRRLRGMWTMATGENEVRGDD